MLSKIRNSVYLRVLWGLMAAYLLNISVDSADPKPSHIKEDLSFNDQESIIEIVLEQLLGYENAIAEYDDHDTEDYNSSQTAKINLARVSEVVFLICLPSFTLEKLPFVHANARLAKGFSQLDTPPPKA